MRARVSGTSSSGWPGAVPGLDVLRPDAHEIDDGVGVITLEPGDHGVQAGFVTDVVGSDDTEQADPGGRPRGTAAPWWICASSLRPPPRPGTMVPAGMLECVIPMLRRGAAFMAIPQKFRDELDGR